MIRSAEPNVFVIIPALNEQATVGGVVTAAIRSAIVHSVIVVDNGSTDATPVEARAAGAVVTTCLETGKAEAVLAGLRTAQGAGLSKHGVVVLLDGDLKGLSTEHVDSLIQPLLEKQHLEMVCGHLSRAGLHSRLLKAMPHPLTGQRAIRAPVFERIDWSTCTGYFLEIHLTSVVYPDNMGRVIWPNVEHTRRENKPTWDWASKSRLPRQIVGPWIRAKVAVRYLRLMALSIVRRHLPRRRFRSA